MWRSNVSIAIRLLARHRVYAAINIGGLALGLAGCLLIWSYIRHERSYDTWLPDHERVYQVQATWNEPGQPVSRSQNSPYPVRAMLAGGFPQIEALTVVVNGQTVLMREGKPIFLDWSAVDPAFFDILRLPFVSGSAATALPDTNSVVLTESEAIRQFGTSDATGRTIAFGAGEGKRDKRVGGVIRDLPRNSSLKFAVIVRYNQADYDWMPPEAKSWGSRNQQNYLMYQQHYVKLRRGADAAAINAALPAWEKRVIAPRTIDGRTVSHADILDLQLVRISDVHLGAAQDGALTPAGDPRTLATFAIVALLTLGMAIINFVNLSTARATQRAREVALRKVLGAHRRHLIVQFLSESLLLAAAATLIALTIVELAAPIVGELIGAELAISYFGVAGIFAPALALFAVTGLLGGLYPAFYLSRFQPAAVLRANRSAAEAPGQGRLRIALVLIQFAIAIGLIASTAIIASQTRFAATVDPGYRRDGLIQIDSAWRFAGSDRYAPARAQLLAVPGVVAAGRTNLGLAAENKSIQAVTRPGAPQGLSMGVYAIDPDFVPTMEMRLLAGRPLGERFAGDRILRDEEGERVGSAGTTNVVVNRNAARLLGFATPRAAIGETIRASLGGGDMIDCTIVGVVEDTRIRTARDPIEPLVYTFDPNQTSQVIVRYAAARPGDVMEGVEQVWRRFEPEIPFDGHFAEDIIAEVYAADRARAALFATFAALAVTIACLGLYSLAAFATERRTKEIGIRKVVGATVRDIVRLLAWQFSKPVVLANLVAWPVAWWAMRDWLNTFDARIALTPGPFLLAGLLALAIALTTVAGHAIRVARTNPIHALRYE